MLIYQRFIDFLLEATPGFEPGIRVLQTRALATWLCRHILNYMFILKKYNLYNNFWSGKRGSNPRPLPWQGSALSTELFPHFANNIISKIFLKVNSFSFKFLDASEFCYNL